MTDVTRILNAIEQGDAAIVILLRDDDMDINYVIAADLLHCSGRCKVQNHS